MAVLALNGAVVWLTAQREIGFVLLDEDEVKAGPYPDWHTAKLCFLMLCTRLVRHMGEGGGF